MQNSYLHLRLLISNYLPIDALLQKLLNSLPSLNNISDSLLDLQELLKGEVRDLLSVAVHFEVVRVTWDDLDEKEVGGAGC